MEIILACSKEVTRRIADNTDVDIKLDSRKDIWMVGTKNSNGACFIFTIDKNHNNLLLLSKYIILNGLEVTIEKNYELIATDEKIKRMREDLDSVVVAMVRNVDQLLDRGEKIEELVTRSKYLSDQSKIFYTKSKKMNRCCAII